MKNPTTQFALETTQQIASIALTHLRPHPLNANLMPPAVMKKLRRHIEKTGRYEPLIVRPHPSEENAFQLINGHHRKQILESLGHEKANCLVWNLDDAETLLLLATINRLGGEDTPGKRVELLDALAQTLSANAHDLALVLPEKEAALAKLLGEFQPLEIPEAPSLAEMPEAFTVFLKSQNKKRLLAALKNTHPDPAIALLQWADTR